MVCGGFVCGSSQKIAEPVHERLLCTDGHRLTFSSQLRIRRHACRICRLPMPRSAPRYVCDRCSYHVCYNCAVHYSGASRSSTDGDRQMSRSGSNGSEAAVAPHASMRTMYRERLDSRHSRKEQGVAISMYYDIVSPSDGEIRTHPHKRGTGIADDCSHAAFTRARLASTPPDTTLSEDGEVSRATVAAARRAHLATSVSGEVMSIAETVVNRGMALTDLVGSEGEDCLDREWKPRLPNGSGNVVAYLLGVDEPASSAEAREKQREQCMPRLLALCAAARQALQEAPVVAEVPAPARIYGDVHGQLRDLLLLFHFFGKPTANADGKGVPFASVFNGDWVDRGRHQLEVIVLLFALRILYPTLVFLLRGNHEDVGQNRKTTRQGAIGFDKACELVLGHERGERIFAACHAAFEWLPLAARIGGRVLVLHGGLGRGEWTLEAMRNVQRPLTSQNLVSTLDGAVYNVLWSDPVHSKDTDPRKPERSFGVHGSHRAKHNEVLKLFGRDVTERFCAREHIDLLVRSHQFKSHGKGYELMHDGWLMRIFSARNYQGKHMNDAGVLLVGFNEESITGSLLVRPQVIQRLEVPTLQLATASPLSCKEGDRPLEPYCPRAHLMTLIAPRRKSSCIPRQRGEEDNPECNMCGAEDLQLCHYFHCRGCGGYDLCLSCGERGGIVEEAMDDSDDSDDVGFAISEEEEEEEVSSGQGLLDVTPEVARV
eukprot:TRINITY_DN12715_c0_g1_i1.p1 TRINITY_DN12715_c0_g1~~TRINITY_DN12715_c0_g1_i1.p1  ORF type:complete len:723 (-),score=154.54 TRINITY_DN12715_c0_g1_i1:177-2321(-)